MVELYVQELKKSIKDLEIEILIYSGVEIRLRIDLLTKVYPIVKTKNELSTQAKLISYSVPYPRITISTYFTR